MPVPSRKLVGSIEIEIWTIVSRKIKWRHNDVITHQDLWNSNAILRIAFLSGIPNFILIGHMRDEIHSREVNRGLWEKKMCHCDLDQPIKTIQPINPVKTHSFI